MNLLFQRCLRATSRRRIAALRRRKYTHHHHYHHRHVACPVDVAVATNDLHACRFYAE